MSLTPHVAFRFLSRTTPFPVGLPMARTLSPTPWSSPFAPATSIPGGTHSAMVGSLFSPPGCDSRAISAALRFVQRPQDLTFPPHWLTVATVRSRSDRLCSRPCPSFNRSDFQRVTRLRDWLLWRVIRFDFRIRLPPRSPPDFLFVVCGKARPFPPEAGDIGLGLALMKYHAVSEGPGTPVRPDRLPDLRPDSIPSALETLQLLPALLSVKDHCLLRSNKHPTRAA